MLQAVRMQTQVDENGEVRLTGLPLKTGERVEVIVLAEAMPEPQFDERMARRKAATWLAGYVGMQVMPGKAILLRHEGRVVWRFPAWVGALHREPRGPIGHVDVDATTGEMLAPSALAEELITNGPRLARPTPVAGN